MPLTLAVDTPAWHEHLRAAVASDPSLVPVAKGNGYGFTVPLLTRTAAGLGVKQIAVGTTGDADVALRTFPGEVIVLQATAETDRLLHVPGRRVLYTAASVRAAGGLARRGLRLVVDCRTSLLRQGISESDLAAVWQVTDGGRAIEAFSVHLPIDRPAGTDPAAETARWVTTLTAAGYRVRTMYVSHLESDELSTLTDAFPGTVFRPRVGTRLWLGRRDALRAAGTVLQVVPVERGQRFGYRQYRSAREGWLVTVAGGSAHGVGLEAYGAQRGLGRRARSLARSGLAVANRVRSPFTWGGRRVWFAEPPHMLVSMLWLPRSFEPPEPGTAIGAQLRQTTTRFDRITLRPCECVIDRHRGAPPVPRWTPGRLAALSSDDLLVGPAMKAERGCA